VFIKKILNFGLLFLVAFIFAFFIQAKDAKAQVIDGFFMYWYGELDSRIYTILPEFVVVNTTHGYWGRPYTSSDIADLKVAGIKVVGYTTVSYTNRAIGLLQNEIIGMAQSDNVDGIFLDECPADPGSILTQSSYLKQLADLAHLYGKFIWCNPGLNNFGSWYITTGGFDYIQATEHWEQTVNQVSSAYASQVSVAGFGPSITESEAVRLTRLAWDKGYRFIYLNDAEYTTMASWFQQYADDLRSGTTPTPTPTPVTILECAESDINLSDLKTHQVGDKTVSYDGLVPCGKCVLVDGNPTYIPCQLCHFIIMAEGIFDFILFRMIPVIAILLIIIGGVMYVVSAGNATSINRAKSIITSVLMGLAIILTTWLIINTVFIFIGVNEWTGLKEGWFKINCEIILPTQ
jgi:hypothetical protein